MLNWIIDPVQAWMPNYQAYANSITDLVEDVLAKRADEIERWLKENHTWKNRTGLAESGLTVAMVRDGLRVTLIMYYNETVFERRTNGDKIYPPYLERWMQGGRFSVLKPALDYWGATLLEDLRAALK